MTVETPLGLRVRRRFEASAERVFDAWLDPQQARRFLFTTPSGRMGRVEIEARVGGRFVIVDRRDGEDVEHTGEYLEIDRPRRLVFTIAVEKYTDDAERVEIEIVPLESGCELLLTQTLSPSWTGVRAQIEEGWREILETLAGVLGESAKTT